MRVASFFPAFALATLVGCDGNVGVGVNYVSGPGSIESFENQTEVAALMAREKWKLEKMNEKLLADGFKPFTNFSNESALEVNFQNGHGASVGLSYEVRENKFVSKARFKFDGKSKSQKKHLLALEKDIRNILLKIDREWSEKL